VRVLNNISSIWYITHWELLLRMAIAAVLGGLIGLEREWNNHAAGFRTHILVCLGSATIMLLSIYGFSEFVSEPNVRIDPARLSAQVISGIGFLGAGVILRNGTVISGLTTAASVWVVAAIGLCVGAGFMFAACSATLMVLVSLFLFNKWEKYLLRHRRNVEISIQALDNPGVLGKIASIFGEHAIQIVNVKMIPEASSGSGSEGRSFTIQLIFNLKVQTPSKLLSAIEQVSSCSFITGIETSRNLSNPSETVY
jgi:putative Mg2+ transporter-C (MgtC) family protein